MATEQSSPPDLTLETALNALTATQLTFVSARLWQTSDKAAAKQMGISPSTVYNWPAQEKEAIRWLQSHYTTNAIQVAQELLTQALIKATMVKINALDADSETLKQDAATEIMDRIIGKPRHAVDITTNQPILKTYVNVSPDMWDEEG